VWDDDKDALLTCYYSRKVAGQPVWLDSLRALPEV